MIEENDKYLDGVNILFISPAFFGYEEDIISELKYCGANVEYIREVEYFPKVIKHKFSKAILGDPVKNYKNYFHRILNSKKYDILFVIKGISFDQEILSWIKNIKCQKILYQYDSSTINPQILNLIDYFDKVFTFDYEDFKTLNAYNIQFRPLFFSKSFSEVKNRNQIYKVASVCSFYPKRYKIIREISQILGTDSVSFYVYIPFLKLLKNFTKIGVCNALKLKIYKLKRDKLINFMAQSTCILDIEFTKQKGLTIRTIETMGMNKKLITTNVEVQKYDFYHPNNIFILTDKNIREIDNFLTLPSIEIDKKIKKKYEIQTWCFNLFVASSINFIKD